MRSFYAKKECCLQDIAFFIGFDEVHIFLIVGRIIAGTRDDDASVFSSFDVDAIKAAEEALPFLVARLVKLHDEYAEVVVVPFGATKQDVAITTQCDPIAVIIKKCTIGFFP